MLLKGRPTNISEEIELPDIAELISYPTFQDIHIDDVWKYGTDLHRKLISMSPVSDKKSHITVHSGVKLLIPGYRSCTGGDIDREYDTDREWHIDFEERYEGKEFAYWEDRDIVTLLTNKTSAMTEFNSFDINLNIDPLKVSYDDFSLYLTNSLKNGNPLGIIPWTAPANRLITFTNHLHRATEPSNIEFRYMFRLLQSGRKDSPKRFNPNEPNVSTIMRGTSSIIAIEKNNEKVSVFFPSTYKNYYKSYEYENQSSVEHNVNFESFKKFDFYFEDLPSITQKTNVNLNCGKELVLNNLILDKIEINDSFLKSGSKTKELSKKYNNPIFFLTNEPFYRDPERLAFKNFMNEIEKSFTFVAENQVSISGKILEHFAFEDDVDGKPLCGMICELDRYATFIRGEKYSLKINGSGASKLSPPINNYIIKE